MSVKETKFIVVSERHYLTQSLYFLVKSWQICSLDPLKFHHTPKTPFSHTLDILMKKTKHRKVGVYRSLNRILIKEIDHYCLMPHSRAFSNLRWHLCIQKNRGFDLWSWLVTSWWRLRHVLHIFAYIQRHWCPFKLYPPSPEANAILNCLEMLRHLKVMILHISFICCLLMSAS